MYKCSQCGVEKETKQFHKDRYAPKGHRTNCKTCQRTRVSKYNRSDRGKKMSVARRLRDLPKVKARDMVRIRMRHNTVLKQPCEVCGELKVEAHHDDYNKPLSVRWLCMSHHRELHRFKKETDDASNS